jgi:hypothetical protein
MTQDVLYEREKKEMARDSLYAYIDQSLDAIVAVSIQSDAASVLLYNKKDVVGLIREVLRREFNE